MSLRLPPATGESDDPADRRTVWLKVNPDSAPKEMLQNRAQAPILDTLERAVEGHNAVNEAADTARCVRSRTPAIGDRPFGSDESAQAVPDQIDVRAGIAVANGGNLALQGVSRSSECSTGIGHRVGCCAPRTVAIEQRCILHSRSRQFANENGEGRTSTRNRIDLTAAILIAS